ncbi:alpha/beta fold hydrolase [Streptomyces tendae]|uniref:alpha/beta fold hydrolase n=1 Tax=Streptomyces tendae TaxID=1932 RepID=UPI00381CF710
MTPVHPSLACHRYAGVRSRSHAIDVPSARLPRASDPARRSRPRRPARSGGRRPLRHGGRGRYRGRQAGRTRAERHGRSRLCRHTTVPDLRLGRPARHGRAPDRAPRGRRRRGHRRPRRPRDVPAPRRRRTLRLRRTAPDLREVVLVGHSYSGIPVGQAAERIGGRLARVIFVDASVPTDGESFVSVRPDGGAAVEASLAENGEFWPLPSAAHYDGEGLTDEQIARLVRGSTPHPGATLTEPAVLAGPLGELPATYVLCVMPGAEPDDAEPDEDVAESLNSKRWQLVRMATGHWPTFSKPRDLAQILLNAAVQ